jgi:hypothetical protein
MLVVFTCVVVVLCSFFFVETKDTLTILAIIVGPILAVLITRYVDEVGATKARKLDIFRTLMRTRKMPIHFDHVAALNMVEIDFFQDEKVIKSWKEYLTNLSTHDFDKREKLLTALLSEIARNLKIKIQQLDILEGNYIPQGWVDDDQRLRELRQLSLEVLSGRTPISIRAHTGTTSSSSPYPPPPTVLKE